MNETPQITSTSDSLSEQVAKLLGWTIRQEKSPLNAKLVLTFYIRPDGEEQASPWPDFSNNSDAIFTVVRKLPNDRHVLYVAALARVVYADYAKVGGGQFTKFQLVAATANQHTRAFVATMEASRLTADSVPSTWKSEPASE